MAQKQKVERKREQRDGASWSKQQVVTMRTGKRQHLLSISFNWTNSGIAAAIQPQRGNPECQCVDIRMFCTCRVGVGAIRAVLG